MSLAEVTLIDTRCLGWLVMIHRRFCEAGGKLVVHSIRPQVTEILEVLRFELILDLAEDETAALGLLRAKGPPVRGMDDVSLGCLRQP